MHRWQREVLIFIGTVGGSLLLLPPLLGVLGMWSKQALFVEMVRAFWTYLFHLTAYASLVLYALVMLVRGLVWGMRRLFSSFSNS